MTATLGSEVISREVLTSVLTEIEGILNSKPLSYVSSDVADPDPITPNLMLMGQPDPSLPLAVYHDSEVLVAITGGPVKCCLITFGWGSCTTTCLHCKPVPNGIQIEPLCSWALLQ